MTDRLLRGLLYSLVMVLALAMAGCIGIDSLWGAGSGICGLIVLVLDIIAIVEIAGSGRTVGGKLLWVLFIIFAPIVGLIVYYLVGR